MARCAGCNKIMFGGVERDGLRYCNDGCADAAAIQSTWSDIPEDLVVERARDILNGPCPECGNHGNVDWHTAHYVWSFLVMTSYKSTPRVCCVGCARRAHIMATLSNVCFGWWGFPWGLLMTPVQVCKNVVGLARCGASDEPSDTLRTIVRTELAAALHQRLRTATAEQQALEQPAE
ncbi:MAG: hypothetical protein KF774_03785 [Planctomyces sp.]|nr:hypothetical protein [Planctomyces sp.]